MNDLEGKGELKNKKKQNPQLSKRKEKDWSIESYCEKVKNERSRKVEKLNNVVYLVSLVSSTIK